MVNFNKKISPGFLPIILISICSLLAIIIASGVLEKFFIKPAKTRIIEIKAYQFAFEPNRIHVKVNEPVIFKVTSQDVTHGFYIDGTSIKESLEPFQSKTIGPIVFDKPAKLKIRCAHFCGPLHPFMIGDLIVNSTFINYFPILLLITFFLFLTILWYVWKFKPVDSLLGCTLNKTIDLFKVKFIGPYLKKFFKWRPSHFWILLPNLWIILIIFSTSIVGNPLGALNFSIAIIWILWFCLVEVMILFGGRLWCMMCPLPIIGEWIARRRLSLGPKLPIRFFSLNLKWPGWLNNSWVASIGFLAMSLPIVWLITRPSITGLLFIGLTLIAIIIPLIFDGGHRRFCDHLCPAFYIGYHASSSAVAIEPVDETVCREHKQKDCIKGNENGYGCPWMLYPGGKGPTGKSSSTHCNLCHECVKSCPLDNMTFKLRMPGKEVVDKMRSSADEAWQGFIRLSLAIFYEFVFFGAYFWIKDWGNMGNFQASNLLTLSALTPEQNGFIKWLKWDFMVGSISLVILPAIFFLFVFIADKMSGLKEKPPLKKVFLTLSYAISPYGQLLWISFGLSLLVVNWAYPLKALFSDPLGWGWNFLGLSAMEASAHELYLPIGAQYLPIVQYIFSLFALFLVIQVTFILAYKLYSKEIQAALRITTIMAVFYLLATFVFMGVFLA